MRRKGLRRWCCIVAYLALMSIRVWANSPVQVDTTGLTKGVIGVSYNGSSTAKMKVMIEKDTQKYTYNLNGKGQKETFPLQMGNGSYKVSVLENTSGTKYRLVHSEQVKLELANPNDVYLNSVQNIHWDTRMKAIQKGDVLTKGLTQPKQKVDSVYNYVVQDYSYDYNKLATLPTTYLPVIDETYQVKTGICYDFSALYASILRSQGIPVKLVKGYSSNAEGYHAWNEVYDTKTNQWLIMDTTYDLQVTKKNKKVDPVKQAKAYQKVNEY